MSPIPWYRSHARAVVLYQEIVFSALLPRYIPHALQTIVIYLIRVLEAMFVVGAVGCAVSVIPITAYRLIMVLFEPNIPGEEDGYMQGPTNREPLTSSHSVSSLRQAG